jgi:hypothetical protein
MHAKGGEAQREAHSAKFAVLSLDQDDLENGASVVGR